MKSIKKFALTTPLILITLLLLAPQSAFSRADLPFGENAIRDAFDDDGYGKAEEIGGKLWH